MYYTLENGNIVVGNKAVASIDKEADLFANLWLVKYTTKDTQTIRHIERNLYDAVRAVVFDVVQADEHTEVELIPATFGNVLISLESSRDE